MREIKFRAWHVMGSVMKYQDRYCFIIRDGRTLGNGKDKFIVASYDNEKDYTYLPYGREANSILMQYTGFKSKDGVEIYEGDILKHPKATVQIKWNEKDGCFEAPAFEGDYSLVFGGVKNCKIIGNIYENPELLK